MLRQWFSFVIINSNFLEHGLISWAAGNMSRVDTTNKMNTQDVPTKELIKLEAGWVNLLLAQLCSTIINVS